MVDYTGYSDYGISRLDGSLVIIKGLPAWVTGLQDDVVLYSRPGNLKVDSAPIEDMNNSELPLGYMNGEGVLRYVVRMPSRQWRQGLRRQSLFDTVSRCYVSPQEKGFSNTLLNIYPSLGDCMESISCGESSSKAFCRSYCIYNLNGNKYGLSYKNYRVGEVNMSKHYIPHVDLKDEYIFLREDLEEKLVNV